MWKATARRATGSVLILIILTSASFSSFAATNQVITTTIKLSVCGNTLPEAGEDCDGSIPNGFTCADVGYGTGPLSCDYSCSFDISGCSGQVVLPTPTPVNTPGTTPEIPAIVSQSPSPPLATPGKVLIPAGPITAILPPLEALLDPNRDGKYVLTELPIILSNWVTAWRNSIISNLKLSNEPKNIGACDANTDGTCDLKDLSILLYHVDR